MKARTNKFSTPISTTKNTNNVFHISIENCKKLTPEEKSLLVEMYLSKKSRDYIAKRIRYYAEKKGVPPFKTILNKKNISKEKIQQVFCKAIEFSDELLNEIVNLLIKFINIDSGISNSAHLFTSDILHSTGQEFLSAIKILNGILKKDYLILFLKITGYIMTKEQLNAIDDFFEKCKNEEEMQEISNTAQSNKKEIEGIKSKIFDLETLMQPLNMNYSCLSTSLKSEIDEFNNRLNNIFSYTDSQLKETFNQINLEIDNLKNVTSIQIKQLEKRITLIERTISKIELQLTDTIKKLPSESFSVSYDDWKQSNNQISYLKNEIKSIKETISETLKENAGDKIYIVKPTKLSGEIEICENQGYFIDLLRDNLKEYSKDISAEYIAAILSSGTVPLFCGFNAREIATIVSISITGEAPYILSIPQNYNDSEALNQICINTDTRVILIEDMLDNMNERLLYILIREHRKNIETYHKHNGSLPYIFLSCESSEEFSLLKKNIFNHLTVIQCPHYIKHFKADSLQRGSAEHILNKISESNTSIDEIRREFKKIKQKYSLPDIYFEIKLDIISRYSNVLLLEMLIENEIKYIISEDERREIENERKNNPSLKI